MPGSLLEPLRIEFRIGINVGDIIIDRNAYQQSNPLKTIREHEARMPGMGQSRQFGRAPITSGLSQKETFSRVRRHVSNVP